MNIKVLGTHFDVSAYATEENIKTVLLEGSVAISQPTMFGLKKDEVVLKPYQKADFDKEKNIIEVSDEPNADLSIAWTKGWLQFSKECLPSVLRKLERYYNVDIRMPQNFPSSELITGKLDLKDSIEDVLTALADVAKIEYRINKNTIYIDKKLKKLPMK